jgi:hypothetical protein
VSFSIHDLRFTTNEAYVGSMKNLSLAILLLFCTVSVCRTQVSAERAQAIAATATRAEANDPESTPLRVHRREDLEDDLFRPQIKSVGRIAKAAYFYEVSNEGSFVLSPNEAVDVISDHGRQIRLVAVSTMTGQTYLLSGFKDAATEFNRLAKDANVKIDTAQDAKLYAIFYYTITADPLGQRLMFSQLQFKHNVEDYFFGDYPKKTAAQLYRKWWSSFSSRSRSTSFDASPTQNHHGFQATLTVFSSSVQKIPQLDLWTLQISPDGLCQIGSIRKI